MTISYKEMLLTLDAIHVKAIVRKAKCQFTPSAEANLMFSIFEQATRDLFVNSLKSESANYLVKDIPHLEILGISSKWIRQLIKKTYEFKRDMAIEDQLIAENN